MYKYDVAVIGLGTAGAIALITAAKCGLKVIGIERLDAMGGTGTIGKISGYYYGASGGYFEELDNEVLELQHEIFTRKTLFSPEAKAYILEKNAVKYGAEIMYNTVVTEVETENSKVRKISVVRNGVAKDISAKIFIDCTAECDVCHLAGCETSVGRRSDGQTQPFTYSIVKHSGDCVWGTNTDAGYIDHNDSESLAKGILNGLSLKSVLLDDYSMEKDLVTIAGMVGVREGRVIVGDKQVRFEDALIGKTAENPIFYAFSNVDNHGKDTAFEDLPLKDWYVGAGLWGVSFSVGIPAGALIPKGFSGILAAGRCLSVDHSISPCVRMQRDMQKCGEAAAKMAYLAVRDGVDVRDISYDELSELLRKTGCLDERNNVGFQNRVESGEIPFCWHTDINEIKQGMSGLQCGIDIWSARLMGDKIYPDLKEWLKSENKDLRINSAIAIALMGKNDGIDILRDLAARGDGTIPHSTIKYAYTRGTTGIYLLGRLHDLEGRDILYNVIRTRGAFDNSRFTPDELHFAPEDVMFMNYSYAVAALVDIAKAHPSVREEIFDFLKERVLDTKETMEIPLKSNAVNKYDMIPKIKMYIKNAGI